jgi:hypothetical protein
MVKKIKSVKINKLLMRKRINKIRKKNNKNDNKKQMIKFFPEIFRKIIEVTKTIKIIMIEIAIAITMIKITKIHFMMIEV